jgi:hypothetical protein
MFKVLIRVQVFKFYELDIAPLTKIGIPSL